MQDCSVTARHIANGTLILLQMHDFHGITEMTLANARRADIVAMGPKGEVIIVEVKSSVADFRSDHKWPEYLAFCDRYYFAVGHDFPQDLIPDSVGLIVADGFGGAVIRESAVERLPAARRKAMTLKFARLAAQRLSAHLLD